MTKIKNLFLSTFLVGISIPAIHAAPQFVGIYNLEHVQKEFSSSLHISQVLVNNAKTDDYLVNLRFHESEQAFCEINDEFFRLEGEQLVLRKKIEPEYLEEGDVDSCVLVVKIDKQKKEIQFVDKDLICRKEFCSQIFDFDGVKFSTDTRKDHVSLVKLF